MIKEIISKIEAERIKQGISETALAKKIHVDQNKVWRFLSGKTKRPDMDLIEKIHAELGMVSEPQTPYESSKHDDDLHPDEIEKILIRLVRERGKGAAARFVAELLDEEEKKKAAK